MTRTEERLTDALAGAAGAVQEDSLRPLADQQGRSIRRGAALPGGAFARRRAWSFWLAPVAAATAVLAVIALMAGITNRTPGQPVYTFRDVATGTSPPPYFVTIEGDSRNVLTVRDTDTGLATDRIQPPAGWHATGSGSVIGSAAWYQSFEQSAVAVADDRVFVVSYDNPAKKLTRLFEFGLTMHGKVTGFVPVPGGALPGLIHIAMAVSPDGSEVAVAGTPVPPRLADVPVQSAKITIVDLRTGTRRVWQGGLTRPGQQLTIPSLSWSANGSSLVYLAQSCRGQVVYDTPAQALACNARTTNPTAESGIPSGSPSTTVREFPVAGPGGRLTEGHVLLRSSPRYPFILQAVTAPRDQLVAVVVRKRNLYIERFAMDGRPLGQPYEERSVRALLLQLGLPLVVMSADSSGRYLMLNIDAGSWQGWIRHGRVHSDNVGGGGVAAAW